MCLFIHSFISEKDFLGSGVANGGMNPFSPDLITLLFYIRVGSGKKIDNIFNFLFIYCFYVFVYLLLY